MIGNDRWVTPLVSDIEALVDGIEGWTPVDHLFTLSTLAHATSHLSGDIVTLGSRSGRSAVVLAAAARDTHGAVHCISPGTSRAFVTRVPRDLRSRLLFLEGDRSYNAIAEGYRLLSPLLQPGGWIACYDACSTEEGVTGSISDLIMKSGEYDIERQMPRQCFAARKRPA
jgi:hypothetical protein